MKLRIPLSLALAAAFVLLGSGCATTYAGEGAALGGAVGAAAGAVIGHQSGHQGEGAALGAMTGAVAGDHIRKGPRAGTAPEQSPPAGRYENRVRRSPSGERYEERVWVPR